MALGRPRKAGALRTASGKISRSRASLLASGGLVHTDWSVYFALCNGLTKIGFSGSLENRLTILSWQRGADVKILALTFVPSERVARALEAKLHQMFKAYRRDGEWFDLGRGDVLNALEECRRLGLRTSGGVDADADMPLLSGMAYTDQSAQGLVVA